MKQLTISLSDIINRHIDDYQYMYNNDQLSGLQYNDLDFSFSIDNIDLENNSVTLTFNDDRLIEDGKFNIDVIGNLNYHKLINIIDSKVISALLNKLINENLLIDINALHINNQDEINQLPFKHQLNDYDLIFLEDYLTGEKRKVTLCDLASIINSHKYVQDVYIRIDILGVGTVYRHLDNGDIIEINSSTNILTTYGANERFTFESNENYTLHNITLDGQELGVINEVSLQNIQESHTLEVEYIKKDFTIETEVVNNIGGYITPRIAEVKYGESIKFYINPNIGYEIVKIELKKEGENYQEIPINDIISIDNVTSNYYLRVTFDTKEFKVKTFINGEGVIKYQINNNPEQFITDQTYEFNIHYLDVVKLDFLPNSNSKIDSIIVNNTNRGSITHLELINTINDYEILCNFTKIKHPIFVIYSGSGTIKYKTDEIDNFQIAPNIIYVNQGDNIVFQLDPANGFHISKILINDIEQPISNTFTINNINDIYRIKIVFDPNKYTITTETDGLGEILPGDVTVEYGSSVSFYANPNSGYSFHHFLIDETTESYDNPYIFSFIDRNHTIKAFFEELHLPSYTITTIAETGVYISPYGQIHVVQGDSITFTFSEDDNYQIEKIEIQIEGQPTITLGRVYSYTLTNISGNGVIRVYSKQLEHPERYADIQLLVLGQGRVTLKDTTLSGPMSEPEIVTILRNSNVELIAIPFGDNDLSSITFDYNDIVNPANIQKIGNEYHYSFIADKDYFIAVSFMDSNYKLLSFAIKDIESKPVEIQPVIHVYGDDIQQLEPMKYKIRKNNEIEFDISMPSGSTTRYSIQTVLINNNVVQPGENGRYSVVMNENKQVVILVEKKSVNPGQTAVFGCGSIITDEYFMQTVQPNLIIFPVGCNTLYYITINSPSNAKYFTTLDNKILASGLSNSTNNRGIISHGISDYTTVTLKGANILNLGTKTVESNLGLTLSRYTYANISFSNGTDNTGVLLGGVSESTYIPTSYFESQTSYNYNVYGSNNLTKINIATCTESLSTTTNESDILSQGTSNLTNDRGIYLSDKKAQILYYSIRNGNMSGLFTTLRARQGNCKVGLASNGTDNRALLVSTEYYNNSELININGILVYSRPCCTRYLNEYVNIAIPGSAKTFCDLTALRVFSRGVSNAEDNRAVFTGGSITGYADVFMADTSNSPNTTTEIENCRTGVTILNGTPIVEYSTNQTSIDIDAIANHTSTPNFYINIDASTLSATYTKCGMQYTNETYIIPIVSYHSMEYYQINNPSAKSRKFGDYNFIGGDAFFLITSIDYSRYGSIGNRIVIHNYRTAINNKTYDVITGSLGQLYPAATSNG